MEFKHLTYSLDTPEKDGKFMGYASVFDCIDLDKDLMTRGAFLASLKAWQAAFKTPLLLWQHNPKEPIGFCIKLAEDTHGLALQGQLLLKMRRAQEAHYLMKKGLLTGLSIGYIPKKIGYAAGGKIRVLREVELKEISLVTFPANPKASVTCVKSATPLP